jgi:ABC-2 type transport system permease protein
VSARRIWLIALKETRHVLRDARTVYLGLGIPLSLLLLFGWALTTDIDHISLIAIDGDRSAESRELISAFERSGLFDVVARPPSAADLETCFRRGEARAALVVPRGYARTLDRGGTATVQIVADGTNANDASIALAYGRAVVSDLGAAITARSLGRLGLTADGGAGPAVEVRSRNRFNSALRSQWYLVPGLIAVILAMVNTLLAALTVAREWERGTMEQLLVTPVCRSEIVIGKLVPYFLLGLGQLVLVTSCGVALFDVPFLGSLLLLFSASVLALLAALGQGLLISIVTRNQQVAMQVSVLTSMLPALLLSGFLSPIASMPWVIQKLSLIIPARHYLVILRGLFLKGLHVSDIGHELLLLAAFAAVLLAASVACLRTRLDR